MKVIIHDLSKEYNELLREKCDEIIFANGKYANCQGCFSCWTKTPAECFINDTLKKVCQIIGRADELVIITKNFYGTYSPEIKAILDRSIAISTPLSTYRGGQMHHTLRYGKHDLMKVYVYGDFSDKEKNTFKLTVSRNILNLGFEKFEVVFLDDIKNLLDMI